MHWDHIFLQQKCAKVGGSLTKYLKLGWLENLGYMADIHIHICVYKYIHMCCGVVVQLLSRVWLSVTPWTAAHQASVSFTVSLRLLRFMSIESVMPSNHLIPCHPLPFLPCLSQHQGLFQRVSSWHQVATVLEPQLQHQSFQWIFRDEHVLLLLLLSRFSRVRLCATP